MEDIAVGIMFMATLTLNLLFVGKLTPVNLSNPKDRRPFLGESSHGWSLLSKRDGNISDFLINVK